MDITGAPIGDNLEATLIQFQDNFDTSFRQFKTTLAPLGNYTHNTYAIMQNLVTNGYHSSTTLVQIMDNFGMTLT